MTDELRIDYLPLSELKRHPRNPKDHDLGAISRSVNRFGFTAPVILDERTGYLAAGHGRIDTLAQLKAQGKQPPANVKTDKAGEWLVPVVRGVAFASDAAIEAYLVADNRITSLGGWNEPELVALLQDLAAEDEALLEVTGYDGDDLQALIDELGGAFDEPVEDKGAQIDRAAELQAQWQTERGQLWIIPSKTAKGEHRLLCGDSTNADDVARVMAGERAQCMWTDPPYGVSYVGKTKNALTIENDGADGLDALLADAFASADGALCDGAAIYIAHPPGALSVTFGVRFLAQGWRLHETLVWVKDSMVLGHSDYHYRHEPILFGYKDGDGRRGRGGEGWYGDNSQTSVLEFARPKSSQEHPTMKPVELVTYCLGNSAPRNGIVLDIFCGSGTTLAACEQRGALGRGVELSETFTAVILQRMADMGLEPRLAD